VGDGVGRFALETFERAIQQLLAFFVWHAAAL
jgi:hypothetical protein